HGAHDQVLIQRVRSRLGRLVSHPHAIEVTAENGKIVLKGLVLEDEISRVLSALRAVPGVTGLENKLEAHDSPEHISSLQGGVRRESRSEFTQQNWTPALRVAAGALGGALISSGIHKNSSVAAAGGIMGAALRGREIFK